MWYWYIGRDAEKVMLMTGFDVDDETGPLSPICHHHSVERSPKIDSISRYSGKELFLIDSKQSILSQTVGQLSSSVRISLFWMLRHLVLASDFLFRINVSLMEFCVFSSDWLEFETELFAYSTGLAVSSIAENNFRSTINQGSKNPGVRAWIPDWDRALVQLRSPRPRLGPEPVQPWWRIVLETILRCNRWFENLPK